MKEGFVREVFLRSTPSIDVDKVEEQIDCTKHSIKSCESEKILEEYCETEEDRKSAYGFIVFSGPQLGVRKTGDQRFPRGKRPMNRDAFIGPFRFSFYFYGEKATHLLTYCI